MTNYTQIKICEIPDPDFQSMVAELCRCVFLGKDQFVNQPLHFLLMAIIREKRAITRQHLPTDGILTKKVDKLLTDSVVYCVCRELENMKGAHIESFDGKTVLSHQTLLQVLLPTVNSAPNTDIQGNKLPVDDESNYTTAKKW
jgi:hypothetical protein